MHTVLNCRGKTIIPAKYSPLVKIKVITGKIMLFLLKNGISLLLSCTYFFCGAFIVWVTRTRVRVAEESH